MYHKFLGCPGAFGKVYMGKFWSDTEPPASKQVAIKTLKSKSSHAYIHQYKVELAHMCRCESRVCCFVNIRICLKCSCLKSVALHMMTTLYSEERSMSTWTDIRMNLVHYAITSHAVAFCKPYFLSVIYWPGNYLNELF